MGENCVKQDWWCQVAVFIQVRHLSVTYLTCFLIGEKSVDWMISCSIFVQQSMSNIFAPTSTVDDGWQSLKINFLLREHNVCIDRLMLRLCWFSGVLFGVSFSEIIWALNSKDSKKLCYRFSQALHFASGELFQKLLLETCTCILLLLTLVMDWTV